MNAGYADACGWESRRAKGNTKYNRLRDFEKINRISSLQSIPTVTDGLCGVNTAEGVLLPSALAITATVLVPSVPTGVTTGHSGCLVVTAAVVLTVAIDLKRSGTYRPGFVRTLSRFFAVSLANRYSSVLWVSPTVLICAGTWLCHAAGGFTLLLLLSRLGTLSF